MKVLRIEGLLIEALEGLQGDGPLIEVLEWLLMKVFEGLLMVELDFGVSSRDFLQKISKSFF